MSTTKKRLIQIRTNTNFSLNYETKNLIPQHEIILLMAEPRYKLNGKGDIMKGNELSEFRFMTDTQGLNHMIGNLQALAASLQQYDQISSGLNMVNSKLFERGDFVPNVPQLNEVADYTSKLNLKNRIMNAEKTSLENENQPSCLGDVISRFNSDTFIDNVCLSYRHDFGLMAEQDRQRLRFECKEWMRAISNNWEYFKNGL